MRNWMEKMDGENGWRKWMENPESEFLDTVVRCAPKKTNYSTNQKIIFNSENAQTKTRVRKDNLNLSWLVSGPDSTKHLNLPEPLKLLRIVPKRDETFKQEEEDISSTTVPHITMRYRCSHDKENLQSFSENLRWSRRRSIWVQWIHSSKLSCTSSSGFKSKW